MVRRICPLCSCEDSCGREASVFRPPSHSVPTPTAVHAAVLEFYGSDRAVLDADSSSLAQGLASMGYLNSMPKLGDVEHAQALIREVERYQ
jgi:hypothetical protein